MSEIDVVSMAGSVRWDGRMGACMGYIVGQQDGWFLRSDFHPQPDCTVLL